MARKRKLCSRGCPVCRSSAREAIDRMYLQYKPLSEITGAFAEENFSEADLRRHAHASGLFEARRVSLDEVIDVALHRLLSQVEQGEPGDKVSTEVLKAALRVYIEESRSGCGMAEEV